MENEVRNWLYYSLTVFLTYLTGYGKIEVFNTPTVLHLTQFKTSVVCNPIKAPIVFGKAVHDAYGELVEAAKRDLKDINWVCIKFKHLFSFFQKF